MAGERDRDAQLLSAGVALACHVGLGWWLLRPMPPPPATGPEPALQVTWIEPARSSSTLLVPPPRPPSLALPDPGEPQQPSAGPATPSTRAGDPVISRKSRRRRQPPSWNRGVQPLPEDPAQPGRARPGGRQRADARGNTTVAVALHVANRPRCCMRGRAQ